MSLQPVSTLPARSGAALEQLNLGLEGLPLDAFLGWAVDAFGAGLAHVTSFGPTGMVILDQLLHLNPRLRVITLDTHFLFGETYELWERVERRYGLHRNCQPKLSPEAQAQQYGPHLWEVDPNLCCDLRKVRPMADALAGLAAWCTGVRRDQGPTRATTPLVAWDGRYQLFKLNPLAAWTRDDVWSYIRTHNLPYNRLHDHGYGSIGCTHCTQPSAHEGDERSGRWAGTAKTECGLHWAQPAPGAFAV
ncbi:MAG: phosphoadenylyl-sulfate reductase [Anaerolineales bacterium]|nr:phosphoadenylyl-sulfate reductase [Anaerolineales bacterium]